MKKKLCALLILLLVFSLSFGTLALAEWTEASEEAAAQESEETAGAAPVLSAEDEAEEEAALGLAAKPDMEAEAEEKAGEPEETEAAGEAEKPLQESSRYVTDEAGILSEAELERLEQTAAKLSEELQVGIYIITVQDYRAYNTYSVVRCTEQLYEKRGLGIGPDKDGILLLLSMNDRDYSLTTFGYFADYVFGDHNKTLVEKEFLDNFRNNDWGGGFEDYLSQSGDLLATALDNQLNKDSDPCSIRGQQYPNKTYYYGELKEKEEQAAREYQAALERQQKRSRIIRTLIVIGVPCLVALIVCSTFKSQMKTAKERSTAEEYVVPGSAVLRTQEDRFVNRTESRVRINSDSGSGSSRGGFSGGSSGGSSGGFHSHSGKF